MLRAIRYGLPVALMLGGFVLLAISPDSRGVEGLAMALGAALAVLYLNVLFRQGARGDDERDREEAAREEMARTGRWPDDDPR
jgi:hypothetical protein